MKNLLYGVMVIVAISFIFCSCNKKKKNPVFGDYNTAYTQVQFPLNDTILLRDKIISVSYFTDDQINAADVHLYRSKADENFYTGGNIYINTNWTLQYFPLTDSIEFRWNQYSVTTTSVTKAWRGTKVN